MRQQRSYDEVIIDEALTLSLLAETESHGQHRMDRLRLQKLIFWVAYDWFERRWKGFNYSFFRYRRGPFTKDLYQTEVDLAEAGLISCGANWSIKLTEDGHRLASELIEHVWMRDENATFWEDLRAIIAELAPLPTAMLVQRTYAREVMPVGWREAWPLEDIPIGVDLVRILEESEAMAIIEMTPSWLDTVGIQIARSADDLTLVGG